MRRTWAGVRVVCAAAVVSLALVAGVQRAEGATASSVAGSLLGNPLLSPGVDSLVGGQQLAAEAARRASPEAVAARQRSRTAYSHLSASRAKALLAKAFPFIPAQAGGIGALPAGTRVLGYPAPNAAQISLPGHRLGIVETSQPIAERVSRAGLAPIDLSLKSSGRGYAPRRSDVDVQIPSELSSGVRIVPNGVVLTPLSPGGRALGGSRGALEGSSVVYANSQAATDTLVKPTPTGFQLDAVLRSFDSPERLLYKVDAPGATRLVADPRSGDVWVISAGERLARILAPAAHDADGAAVPVSMSVRGHLLILTVEHRDASYLYPIDVDPEVNDSQLATATGGKRANWEFKSSNETKFAHNAVYEGPGKERLETSGIAEYKATEFSYWAYETKGNSKIYELKTKTSAKNKGAKIESFLQFQTGIGNENMLMLSNEFAEPEYAEKTSTICAWNASGVEECLPGAGKEKNLVRFQQSATASPGANYKFSDTMSEAVVSISEPAGEHSTTSFNTTSPEIEVEVEVEGKKVIQKRTNALYGAGIWLTKFKGALQLIAKDPGIGVATTRLEYEKPVSWEPLSEHRYLETGLCQGVQCFSEHREAWTVDPKLPDGEDKIRYRAEEPISGTVSPASEAASTETIKVDTAAPHAILLHGLPYGNELAEKPYKLVATAIDGTGSTVASSGVKKLALFVSGREVAELGSQTGCKVAKGECQASAEWSLSGAELGAGHHAIVIVATDNAGNESRIEETVSIRHSTPVALGPGSVDLESGDFTLDSTDVSLGSGLTVTRNYSSRAPQAGIESPLGSQQWSLSLGKSESLSELVDGGVLLRSSDGKQSIFAALGAGKFESPMGDSNLTLELEENKTTKEKLAYYLKNAAAGTSDKFTLPPGSTIWVPTKQEGTVATDTVTYTYKAVDHQDEFPLGSTEPKPIGVAAGPDGNIWYTEDHNNKIGKMSLSGTVLAEYAAHSGSPGPTIVTGSDGNLWFLEGSTTVGMKGKIVKMTPGGVQTEYNVPENRTAAYLTEGPDGNIWFTEPFAKKIGKITPGGVTTQYSVPVGEPYTITAGPDGNLWFVTPSTGKIDKITTAGVITEYAAPSTKVNSEAQSLAAGPDGNVWFSEEGKIDKITPSGLVTAYPLSSPSQWVDAILTGPDKNIWFSQGTGDYMAKVTPSGTITEYALERTYNMAVGPDGNMWYADNWNKTIDRTTPSGKVILPTEVLAPVPAGVSCSPELKAGCRALSFTYKLLSNQLESIALRAYNAETKKIVSNAVAEYRYDARGDLREEWDPRYNLRTTYGYDSEGHVTALNPPGEESWAFTYGTLQGDLGRGRLLKVTRPPASGALWTGGEAPKNVELPKVTGSALTGVRMTVSDGAWAGSPLVYGYQWEDCVALSEVCTAIAGANSANYVPTTADIGYKLAVLVSATNGGGTATVSTGLLSQVKSRILECCGTQEKPRGIAQGPGNNLWFTIAKGITKWPQPEGLRTNYVQPAGSNPYGIAAGPDGNMWFTEFVSSGKIGKITPTGSVTTYTLPSGSEPYWIVAGPDGNMWFTNYNTSKVGKITMSGVVTEYSLGTFSLPVQIAVGPDGNMWVAEEIGEIAKVTTSGAVTQYSVAGHPYGITLGPDGNLWFTESEANKVGEITTSGSKTEYSLPSGSGPRGIVAGPDGNLWVADFNSSKITALTTSGATVAEYSLPAKSDPLGIAAGSEGNLWFTDNLSNNVGEIKIGTEGAPRTPSMAWTMEYAAPLKAGLGLQGMTEADVAKWGQTDVPVEATAIVPPDADQGWPATSYKRATVYYLDAQGRSVNVSAPSNAPYGSIATTEYNEFNDPVRTLSPDNRQLALEAGSKSVEVSKLLDTQSLYNGEGVHESEVPEPGTRLIDVEGPQHEVKYMFGTEQRESLARLHTKYFYDEGAPAGVYDLLTKTTKLAHLANEEEVEVRKTVNSYSGQSNLGWKLRAPTSVTVDPEGQKLTTTTVYNPATGQILETRSPAGAAGESAHDQKLVYYSVEANTEGYPACGAHPEWAGLLCQTLPAKQPESAGPPPLPVTVTSAYNFWNEPLTITETFGSTVRTKENTYSGARLTSSQTTSTANAALPRTSYEFNSKTGLLERQSIIVEGKLKTITSKYNALGQLTEYTDADGNTAKYNYGGLTNDFLLEEISDSSKGATGKQVYTHDPTTKQIGELSDSSAGVFTASYDAEGNLTSETYPNAMCANYGRNSVGETTHLEYIKTANCAEHEAPVWFSEARSPSVRGETFSRTSTLANDVYRYDTVGRLDETQETPAGEGCTTRLYAYDEESNRLSLTTRAPGGEGKCATTGGTVQGHSYDEANRLTDAGIAYDSFGNVTQLPAADAEGHELSSTFYVDNAVATQSQNGVTSNYYLDPEGRVREVASGTTSAVEHYDGPGEAVAWSSDSTGKATRNIPGIDGTLTATQADSEPAVLQLHDIEGDIVATAASSPTATKLLSTYNSTEFGAPNAEKAPPKFAWLGAGDIASALSSGVITYGATSYVPQIGRALQSEAVEPPGVPGGSGGGIAYSSQEGPWVFQGAAAAGTEAPGREAARERAAAEAALSVVDPWVTTEMNRKKAEEQAESFWEAESVAAVLSIYDLPSDFTEILGKIAGDFLSQIDDAFAWLHDAGEKLMKCAQNKRPTKDDICQFKYEQDELKLELFGIGETFKWPNFSVEPSVEECKYAGSLLLCGHPVGILDKDL